MAKYFQLQATTPLHPSLNTEKTLKEGFQLVYGTRGQEGCPGFLNLEQASLSIPDSWLLSPGWKNGRLFAGVMYGFFFFYFSLKIIHSSSGIWEAICLGQQELSTFRALCFSMTASHLAWPSCSHPHLLSWWDTHTK